LSTDIFVHGDNFFQLSRPFERTLVFEILHYAGKVPYAIEGFLEKNKNTLNADISLCLVNSQLSVLQGFFRDDIPAEARPGAGSVSGNPISRSEPAKLTRTLTANKTTLCQIFRKELQSLADLLASSERHYVRCIKPNDVLKANLFKPTKVLEQLRSNGVMETVALRKAGYASKMTEESFITRYSAMGIASSTKSSIESFLRNLLPSTDWTIGHTKIFLKTSGMQQLEQIRKQRFERQVIILQRFTRRYNAQKKIDRLHLRSDAKKKRSRRKTTSRARKSKTT